MKTTHTDAGLARRSLLHLYSFSLAILLVPSCVGQGIPANSINAAIALPDAPETAAVAGRQTSMKAPSPLASAYVYVSPTRGGRAHAYLYDLVGPGAFLAPAISSGVDQTHGLKVAYPSDGFAGPGLHPAHGTVPEWSAGFEGYSKRYADRFGQGLLNTTSRYGLAEILREDVTYHRCTCTGTAARAVHALGQTFVAHTRSGRAVPSIPAIVSPFAASEIAVAAWYPSRFKTSDALRISIPIFAGALPRAFLAEFK